MFSIIKRWIKRIKKWLEGEPQPKYLSGKGKKFILKKPTHDPVNFIKTLDTYWKTNIVDIIPQWKKVFDNLHWKQQQELQKLNDVAKKYAG